MERHYYSFVFHPSADALALIAQMKTRLGDSGKNGGDDTSIGIVEFEATESELFHFQEYAATFVAGVQQQTVEFTSFDGVSPSPGRDNGILYFAASKTSLPFLKSLMDTFYAGFPMKNQIWAYVSQKPYITMARGLSKNRLLTAKNLFAGTRNKIRFDCDSIRLRKYDSQAASFEVIQDFIFGDQVHAQVARRSTTREN